MASSFDRGLLEPLLKRAEETHSDAVVVMHQGKTVGVWRFGKPKQLIRTMSVTKSIVNLAIGKLVTDGLIASIEEPVCTFYPEWKQGRKKDITIKHIMNHTSGLQNVPNANEEINSSPDIVQLALCAELSHDPGTTFSYNNKAVNVLAGVVERLSEKKLDDFMRDKLFAPLEITEFHWWKDPAGNPGVLAGLHLFPEDLAKLGQFVLNRGSWEDQQLIDPTWFDLIEAQKNSGEAGLLWWLLRDITVTIDDQHLTNVREANIAKDIVTSLEKLKGIYQRGEFIPAFEKVFGEDWFEIHTLLQTISYRDVVFGNILGYQANGYLGQYIYLFQKEQLVFVRMIDLGTYQDEADDFDDFPKLVTGMANSF
jgi:CubicO group peptidase (beta-lactamase class C family)